MTKQNHTEDSPVVGADGELLQADPTVNSEAYTEYVATYVHRDPLWFRIRENISEFGCAYLFFTPPILCFGGTMIQYLFSNRLAEFLYFSILVSVIGGGTYLLLQKSDVRG